MTEQASGHWTRASYDALGCYPRALRAKSVPRAMKCSLKRTNFTARRSRRVVGKKKRQVRRDGELVCECCGSCRFL